MKTLKTLNLVMAIIYTILLSLLVLVGLSDGDGEIIIGAIMLSGSTVANWITYSKLKNIKSVNEKVEEVEYVEIKK